MSVVTKSPNPEKGKRYIGQLDQALCSGNWSEVPELARKVEKHAPERKCLALTARTEAQIAFATHRPSSAPTGAGASSTHALNEITPKLKAAIEGEKDYPDDAYCGRACLAEIHWRQGDSSATLEALGQQSEPSSVSHGSSPSLGWLEVCASRDSFIRAAASEASGQKGDLPQLYRKVTSQTTTSKSPELRRWNERLIARACLHSFEQTKEPTLQTLNDSLRSFRSWANFWQKTPAPSSSSAGDFPTRVDTPRRQVWRQYYQLLSTILQRDLIYNPSTVAGSDLLGFPSHAISGEQYTAASTRQRSELKRVEATYESLLLNETQFPKASETNTEVEEWVELAVTNWKILCGPNWTDAELGEGGKEGLTRGMLDILYRAATRTFHSTAILRQLFTVHSSIGEFDLAIHAFNSYQNIIGKGKARAEKTGVHEDGFDSDDTALVTASEAVRILCRYGDSESAEKAMEVSKIVEQWLGKESQSTTETQVDANKATESKLQPSSLAAAYRAIGISHAQWARYTFETERRSELQAEAVRSLRIAESYDPISTQTAYALAKVLSERREVPAGIQVLKKCIAAPAYPEDDEDDEDDLHDLLDLERQRELIPLWHLLSLCLTARDEYDPALKMTEAAFSQFDNPNALFGQQSTLHPSGPGKQERNRASRGLVDQMDSFEKETILQIKTTQLTFTELTEGPNVAVDLTDELLALFSRLFGSIEKPKDASKPPPTSASRTPSRGGGTLRSIAGSIRPKSNRNSAEKESAKLNSSPVTPQKSLGDDLVNNEKDSPTMGTPISITVTNEDGVPAGKAPHGHHPHHLHMPFRKHHDQNTEVSEKAALESGEAAPAPPPKDTEAVDHATQSPSPAAVGNAVSNGITEEGKTGSKQALNEIPHNVPHQEQPAPLGHPNQPPQQDLRLPAPHPALSSTPGARLAYIQERQQKTSLLVQTWLFIAGLYLRADLYEDANGALEEASRLVESFEIEKAAENSSAREFYFKGWGGGKSVDALWADVFSAKGELALARDQRFDAMSHYEEALVHYPDHAEGIMGVSNLLMDIYEEKMPAEKPTPPLTPLPTASGHLINAPRPGPATSKSSVIKVSVLEDRARNNKEPTPAELNRLAARDRAYMLLSNLTKLGSGWDNSEAWLTLARSHELSGQVKKAKQALWWVVELEDNKPMRPWRETAAGGYAL